MNNNDSDAAIINVPEAPAIGGLVFRRFHGERDYPGMVAVIDASKDADGIESSYSVEELARNYRHLVNCDLNRDVFVVEMEGEVIGYSRVWWQQIEGGPCVYSHFTYLVPRWRRDGLRRAMLRQNERRLREIASAHPVAASDGHESGKAFEVWGADTERDWIKLLAEEGYEPVRYSFEMVRDHLNGIPDLPLPDGVEVRAVTADDYQRIWNAAREAFRDHWGFSEAEWDDTHLEGWMEDDTFQPDLWQVAWDGDEVAGMVLNFIDEAQNLEYGRRRGYTETICVRRPWRRRGLARALIARSLKVHKTQGMTETALGVDAHNPNGALRLYQSMGYVQTKQYAAYRKPLDAEQSVMKERPG